MLSIGALAIAPSNPDVLWVGTGEANDRNSSGWGNGVYRSTDGGDHWQHLGLDSSRAINRLVVDPRNAGRGLRRGRGQPLGAKAGSAGYSKPPTAARAGRKSSRRPPPRDTVTGCGDVALDPANPDTLYAALYARRRTALVVRVRAGRPAAATTWAGSSKAATAARAGRKLTDGLAAADRAHRTGGFREQAGGGHGHRAE